MLSINGGPPPDLSCACDESIPTPLNSTDERASSPSPQLPDLTHNPSLPSFSIRNYVSAARSKNISTNWPFSLRNLQLCLKHGVKDPLPPFQSVDNVRNRSFPRFSVETSSSLKEEIVRINSTEEPLGLNNDEDDTKSDNALADNNFPSTTTSVSQLETVSVPTNRRTNHNSASVEPDTLLGTSVEKEITGPTVSRKTDTAVRSVGKKGRLVLRLGGNLERSSTEDIASASTAVSETMTSKVCPVCKTFSSSSNTTLNAHIDQCLSEEPTPKWSAGSKLIRHRIKPRKTRLMVDIYETARPCTLEDLDRRNGTNWATGASLPSQDTEEKMQRISPVNLENDAGAVYIDSNGTKLRILSRFSDSQPLSTSRAVEDLGPKKCLTGKANKFLLSKKMKRKKKMKMKMKQNAQKNHKYLKLVSQSKDFRYRKARLHDSQEFCGQETNHGATSDGEDTGLLVSRSQGPSQSSDSGTLKQWACSKRSGPLKKVVGKDQHPHQGCTLHVARELLVERGRSCFTNNLISDGHDSDSSEDPRNSERTRVPVIEGESPRKRKLRSPLFHGRADSNVEGSNFPPTKRRESPSDPFSYIGGCEFHGSHKSSISPFAYGRSSKSSGISATKATRFSRMDKKILSLRSLRKSKLDNEKKGSTRGRSDRRLMDKMNKEDREDDLDPSPSNGTINKMSLARSFVGGFGQDTGKTSTFQEPRYSDSDEGKNAESSVSLNNDRLDKLDGLDSVVNTGQDHGNDVVDGTEDNALNFSKYLNHGTAIENRRIHARSSTDIYKGGLCHIECPTFPGITEEEMGDGSSRPASDVNMDLDTRVGQEYEVERILIPGPPGSFLPSPGALGSEEFQGNSSLTTSRIQSSQEHQDLVDGDSSDSPISATSTISNSAPTGSEIKCVRPPVSTGPPQPLQEKSSSGLSSGGGGIEPLVSNAASSPQLSTRGVLSERKNSEKGPLILKNGDQPCCCQRKERSSQGIVPNYQESQLLRRRNLSSLTAIGLGKRPSRSPNTVPIHVEGRLEMLPRSAPQDIESEMARSSSVPLTSQGSTDNGAKAFDRGESDSATPSVCNPVLRLMGKNLMVVNKEDDASTPLEHSQPTAWSNNCSSSQVSRMTAVSYSGVPVSSSGFRPAFGNKLKTVMEPPAAPPGMSTNWHVSGYKNGTFYFPNQPPRSNVVNPECRDPRPMKEIIIIDDSPEDEISKMPASAIRGSDLQSERQTAVPQVVSFPMKTTVGYDPRLVSAFPFNYPSQDPSFFGQMPVSRRMGSNPAGIRWCSSPEGPGAFQRGHPVPAPSPNIHIRSPLPYSPGL